MRRVLITALLAAGCGDSQPPLRGPVQLTEEQKQKLIEQDRKIDAEEGGNRPQPKAGKK